MPSEATAAMVEMMEALPEHAQYRVVEHLREYIEDLRDDAMWGNSYFETAEKAESVSRESGKVVHDHTRKYPIVKGRGMLSTHGRVLQQLLEDRRLESAR